jgi:hypothetical protein
MWGRWCPSTDAKIHLVGFPHLMVRLAPLVKGRGYPCLNNTIEKETVSGS